MRILLALLFSFFIGTAFSESLGEISSVKGRVSIQSGSSSAKPASVKTPVSEGDLIVTQSDSEAVISLTTGSVIKVGPEARMKINKNTVKSEGVSSFSISVSAGSISAKVAKLKGSSDSFSVYTPSAVAGIRGTDFSVATAADGTSKVQVSEGDVAVSRGAGSTPVSVKTKQKADVDLSEKAVASSSGEDDVAAWLNNKDKEAKKDPDAALAKMNDYIARSAENTKALTDAAEKKDKNSKMESLDLTNKADVERQKKEALDLNQGLNFSKTVSEGILEKAKSLAALSKDPKAKEALNGIERISKAMDDAQGRIDAALARLDARLDAAYKRIEESYKAGSDRIDSRMNGKEDKFKKMDDKFNK
jgi:hypothetical protein